MMYNTYMKNKCEKHQEELVPKGDRYGCRSCNREYQRKWVSDNREKQRERNRNNNKRIRERNGKYVHDFLIKNPCSICLESDPVVLDFDHIDPSTKIDTISNLIRQSHSLEKIQEEIEKCQILCANCHRRKTAIDNNWGKLNW